jgi:exosome complex RNA-binding protein Rrp42 (RNase PH superfamily)
VSEEDGGKPKKEPVNREKRKLTLKSIPFSLTRILHKNYILADPTAEEESVMETLVTMVLDSSSPLIFLYKPGGPVLANTSVIQVSFSPLKHTLKGFIKSANLLINLVCSNPFALQSTLLNHDHWRDIYI